VEWLKPNIAVDELSSGSSDYAASTWIAWFLSTKGNEYFCEIDEDYILDRFNLTGLNTEVQHYLYALDLITDTLDENISDSNRDQIETQARILYGLIHARYVVTTRGLAKMVRSHLPADISSLTSSSVLILVGALVFCAISNRCSPWDCLISHSRALSVYIALDARTYIDPRAHATALLMVHFSVHLYHICWYVSRCSDIFSSWYTLT